MTRFKRHCAYPGHVTAWECDPRRLDVLSPPDKLGRRRRYRVCPSAVEFALRRGYVQVHNAPWTEVVWTCDRGHESRERLTEKHPESRVVRYDLGCPYCRDRPYRVKAVLFGTRETPGPEIGTETGGSR